MTQPTLLFLHYFGGSGRTWTPIADILSDAFHCLTPDLPGWGQRPVASIMGMDATPFSVDAMARFALEQIETLHGEPFALVGHSMGGKVAQAVAAQNPPGLKALVLVAPSPAVPEPMTDADRSQLRAAWGSESEARRIVASITVNPLPPDLFQIAFEDTLRASREAWQAWTDSGSREDISERMAHITVPTRIFAGERDNPLTPAYLQREVAGRIRGADVVTVPNTAHLIPLEAPQALADGIRRFTAPLLSA